MRYLTAGLMLIILTGCGMLGKESPRDTNDQIAYAGALQESLTDTVKHLYTSGHIDRARALEYRQKLDDVHGYLSSAAVFLSDNDIVSTEQRLQMATTILTLLQKELEGRVEQ